MSKYYYEKSGILKSSVNITYHELFTKTDVELDEWIEEARQYIIEDWEANLADGIVEFQKKVLDKLQ